MCRTVAGGPAGPSQDYRDVVRKLVIAVGVRTLKCLVSILDDALPDGPHTVNLQLDTPTPFPATQLGPRTGAVLTINDNG